ncbi:MAG: hypothetical protein RLZ84_612 [Actinomycetota bacterium]|jgi:hypothetical protein
MAQFDANEMIARFKDRAAAVKKRPLPPVAGEERTLFIQQAQVDFQDFAIIGDATAEVEDGVLVLRIDMRPQSK